MNVFTIIILGLLILCIIMIVVRHNNIKFMDNDLMADDQEGFRRRRPRRRRRPTKTPTRIRSVRRRPTGESLRRSRLPRVQPSRGRGVKKEMSGNCKDTYQKYNNNGCSTAKHSDDSKNNLCNAYHTLLIDRGCFTEKQLPSPIRTSDDKEDEKCKQYALELNNAEKRFGDLNIQIQKARDVSKGAREKYNQNCTKKA